MRTICKMLYISQSCPYWVYVSKRGGKDGVFLGLAGLPRGSSRGRSLREILRSSPASLRKTPSVLALPKIHRRFRIGPPQVSLNLLPPKMYRQFRIGPPKMHRRFRIGPPQVSLNLLPPKFHRRGILLTIANMTEKEETKKKKNYLKQNGKSPPPTLTKQNFSLCKLC